MYRKDRYEKLFDDGSRYPYVVALTGSFGFSTGTLISDHFVLTCAHILQDRFYEQLPTHIDVIASKGPTNGSIKFLDHRFDLALVELADPVVCSRPDFADDCFKPGMFVVAVGAQERPGCPDQLVIAETEMKCLTINSWNGGILDIQLDGGARHGYSGGPVFIQQENARLVGLVMAGGRHASTTLVTGLAVIRTFVNKHLPSCTIVKSAEPKLPE